MRGITRQVGGEELARDALGHVAVRALDEFVVPLHRGERRDGVEHPIRRVDHARDLRPLRVVAGREQFLDGMAGIHRDERQHRLAAEELLIGDVVFVDLVALVQVVALISGELEFGRAVSEPDGEQAADDHHRNPVLAQIEAEPGPEPLHTTPVDPKLR
jgi:hypothetical protein